MKKSIIKTGIVFGDVHVPHEDKKAVNILLQIISETKPDMIIDLGDTCDFPSVNHWLPQGSRRTEGQRIVNDLKAMYQFSHDVAEAG